MTAIAHAITLGAFPVTGTRSVVVPPPYARNVRGSAARTVRTRRGLVLYDELGHLVGRVTGALDLAEFGLGARTVLLRRGF